MATYKGFTYNQAGAAPRWSNVEEQLLKDIMATLVMGCCSEEKDTAGHKHYRLHRSGGDAVALTCDADGDVYSVEWAEYTPGTISGWSGTPTSTFRRMTVGDLVFVRYSISGTGNTDATEFSLPYAPDETAVVGHAGCAGTFDGGDTPTTTSFSDNGFMKVSSTKAAFQYDADGGGGSGSDGYSFGNGKTKWLCGQFWYRK